MSIDKNYLVWVASAGKTTYINKATIPQNQLVVDNERITINYPTAVVEINAPELKGVSGTIDARHLATQIGRVPKTILDVTLIDERDDFEAASTHALLFGNGNRVPLNMGSILDKRTDPSIGNMVVMVDTDAYTLHRCLQAHLNALKSDEARFQYSVLVVLHGKLTLYSSDGVHVVTTTVPAEFLSADEKLWFVVNNDVVKQWAFLSKCAKPKKDEEPELTNIIVGTEGVCISDANRWTIWINNNGDGLEIPNYNALMHGIKNTIKEHGQHGRIAQSVLEPMVKFTPEAAHVDLSFKGEEVTIKDTEGVTPYTTVMDGDIEAKITMRYKLLKDILASLKKLNTTVWEVCVTGSYTIFSIGEPEHETNAYSRIYAKPSKGTNYGH